MTVLIAACALSLPSGELPKRLLVLPKGETVRGRDGRAWSMRDEAAILAQLTQPVLLDENHASVHAAPRGSRSPAAGWLSDFKFTDQGLEAAVDWTPYGEELFSKKSYRYLSPALQYDKVGASSDTQGTIRGLHSVGLTNHPNLDLPALNAQETTDMTPEQLKALTDAIAAGFSALEAKLPTQPVKVVAEEAPVAPNAAIAVAVNAVVDAAVTAGKIAPASKADYVAMGGDSQASLERLQKLITGLPALVATNAQDLGSAGKPDPRALSKVELQVVKAMGITEDQYRAQKGELAV